MRLVIHYPSRDITFLFYRYDLSAGTNNTAGHFTAVIKTNKGDYVRFNDLHPSGCFPLDAMLPVDFALYKLSIWVKIFQWSKIISFQTSRLKRRITLSKQGKKEKEEETAESVEWANHWAKRLHRPSFLFHHDTENEKRPFLLHGNNDVITWPDTTPTRKNRSFRMSANIQLTQRTLTSICSWHNLVLSSWSDRASETIKQTQLTRISVAEIRCH